MSNLLKNKFAKVALSAIFVLAAVVAVAPKAKTVNAAACVFTGAVKQGMSGMEVTCLQQYLIGAGFTIPAGATGYFGTQTLSAVMAWQSAHNVSPAAGYFGPISQGVYASLLAGGNSGNFPAGCTSASGYSTTTGQPCNTGGSLPAGCTSTAGYSPTTGQSCSGGTTGNTGALAGTDGTIDNITTISSYSDEEVGENGSDVKVAGFEVEASNDGDVALKSMKVVFDPTANGAGDSDHLDDYVDSVSIWQGSTKIGSASVDDFTENSDDTSSKTISLSNSIVRADHTEKFYITVDSASNLDSGDIDTDDWSVGLESVRYEDGSGVTTTIDGGDSEIDTGAGEIGWDSTDDGIEMDFVDFGTAADTELKISLDSDSPDAGIVMVDDSDVTEGIVLLKGKMILDGDSDITIDEFPVSFSPTTSNLNTIASNLILKIDGEEFSESVASAYAGSTATVVFDNLDMDMSAGDTVEFEVIVDVNGTDDFTAGATLTASVSASNRAMIDAENEEGDQLTASERSGTATGEAQEFRASGVQLTFVSSSTSINAGTSANDDQATLTIRFKVKAVGDTVYISSAADATTSGVTTGKTSNHIDRAGTATTGGASASTVLVNVTDTDLTSVGLFQLDEDEEDTFELTTTITAPVAGAAGQYRAVLGGVSWSTDSTDNTPNNAYTSNLDEFKTSYIGMN